MSSERPTYTIEVVRSRRARRRSLRITREGGVRLTIPWWQPKGLALRWAEERRAWIEEALVRQQKRREANPPLSDEEVEALRRVAKEKLPRMLEEASVRTGLRYRKVTVRKTHSRWGSCTREGNVSLSLYLAALPDELIDYVCTHELCLTVHPNHSQAVHDLVDHPLGGRVKELARKLRAYTPR